MEQSRFDLSNLPNLKFKGNWIECHNAARIFALLGFQEFRNRGVPVIFFSGGIILQEGSDWEKEFDGYPADEITLPELEQLEATMNTLQINSLLK